MNYTGGKSKILDFLLGLFPKDIHRFYDLFCGGLNVSLNAECQSVVSNDLNSRLMGIYEYIASFKDFDELEAEIRATIAKYGLHEELDTLIDGAGSDVASVSREGYEELRRAYNTSENPLLLLVLVFYSFNNCIRFNKQFQFNMPIGKSCYNAKNRDELKLMHYVVTHREFAFMSKSFDEFDITMFGKNDFVYCDPPYLITDAVYNESNNDESGWGEKQERELYGFLDELDSRGIVFGLSNAVSNNGKTNGILNDWMQKYHVFHPDIHYSNSSYQHKSRDKDTVEVYVTNYAEAKDTRADQLELF